jgi:branched-chain amino acid transport system ATP-binding protein
LLQITLIRSIKKIKEERGITTIIAEQYARPVLPIVDYAYIVENGAAVLAGESDELMANPDVRAAYFGL